MFGSMISSSFILREVNSRAKVSWSEFFALANTHKFIFFQVDFAKENAEYLVYVVNSCERFKELLTVNSSRIFRGSHP